MDRDSITQTGARAPGVERNTARTEVPARPIVPDTEQGNPDGGRKHEGRWQTRTRGRPHLIFRPLSRTGENPPYGILGEAMETSASFEARSAPLSYPTAKERPYGSVRGVPGNRYPYRDRIAVWSGLMFLLLTLALAPWVHAIETTDLGQLGNGTKVLAVQSKRGYWDLETQGSTASSATHCIPIEIAYSWGAPGQQDIAQGYYSLRRTPKGFEGTAAFAGPNKVTFHVVDLWTTAGSTLSLVRRLTVAGHAPGGFLSSIVFSVKGDFPRSQVDFFAPGMIYGGTEHLSDLAIGGAATYRDGEGKVRIREDRLPIPMIGVLFHDGSSITVLDPAPIGETTVADSRDTEATTSMIDKRFQFGAVGADDTSAHISTGYWFPGTEGEMTYLGGTYPGGQAHGWRRRYHPIEDGLVQGYRVEFRFGVGDQSFSDFCANDWRWGWGILNPAVYPQDISLVRQSIIDMLAGRVEMMPGGTGIPNSIEWQGPHSPDIDHKAVMGFTGKNLEAARLLLEDADRDLSARGQWHRKLAVAIISSFLRLKIDPPVGEGFDLLTGQSVPAIPRDHLVFLRSFGDDFASLVKAYTEERNAGRAHPEWVQWCTRFGDWLLTQQSADGDFPRSWRPGTGEVADASGLSSYNAVPFLALLSQATGQAKYLQAAIRAADFCWSSGQSHGAFVGGTIDNPDVIDKEAGTLSLQAYLAIYQATQDSQWLNRAGAAADFAETWIYCWNVPMPADEDNGELHWKRGIPTMGLQLIATGHSLVDEYMSDDAGDYAKMSFFTKDPHYFAVARLLLHDTKVMVAIPGRLYDLPGPGWQQEHWSLAPVRGFGLDRAWLPWVATSQLGGIYDSESFNRELFQRLCSVSPPSSREQTVRRKLGSSATRP